MASRVLVIGGGITGLTTAWKLHRQGIDVTVLEASDRLGGKIWSSPIMGLPVDAGPDAFVVREPFMEDLCRELELHNALVPPNSGGAGIWLGGALRAMPKKQFLGIPLDIDELAQTGIVSPEGIERARLDLEAPADAPAGDEAVGTLIRRRLGDEVLEKFTGALLGGINAGNADQLSLQAGVPQVAAGVGHDASLIRSVQAHLAQRRRDPNAPIFLGHPNSLYQVITALSDRLLTHTHANSPVQRLERTADGWIAHTPAARHEADAVVLSTPAFASAHLLRSLAPEAAQLLDTIDYANVIQTTFAFPSRETPDLETNGFLVPRSEGLLMTAATYSSSKWSHLSVGSSRYVRIHAGRVDDTRAMELDDVALVDQLRQELEWTTGITADATEVRVTRWPRSFPQYRPGHLGLVADIERAVAEAAPGVLVTGAAYRGLGLPACVRQAGEAALAIDQLLH